MTKSQIADVVIVGAGTAGSYTGWKLAQAGHSVIIVERNRRGMLGRNIGIFHMDEIRFAQYGVPVPKGNELIGYYPEGWAWPPDGNSAKKVRYAFYVMELPLFINRMQKYAEDAGARIMFQTGMEAPIIERGAVAGVRVLSGGRRTEIRARIVIDASGTDSSVRTGLPLSMGMETDFIRPGDFLYVILQYWDDIPGRETGEFPTGLNFYPFHKAFINPSYGTGAIVGIGQPGSLEAAERVQNEFLAERFPGVKHKLAPENVGQDPVPPAAAFAGNRRVHGGGRCGLHDKAFLRRRGHLRVRGLRDCRGNGVGGVEERGHREAGPSGRSTFVTSAARARSSPVSWRSCRPPPGSAGGRELPVQKKCDFLVV